MDVPTVATSIIGSLFSGGVIAGVTTHYLTLARDERTFLRTKLESAYYDGIQFNNMLMEVTTAYLQYHKDEISLKQVTDKLSQETAPMIKTSNELMILCNVYFPALVLYLDALLKVRDDISYLGPLGREDKPNHDAYKKIVEKFKEQVEAGEQFKKAVYQEGQKISRSIWGFRPASEPGCP
jgi:hypothetical protein